jgi:hypothetical protein
MKVMVAIGENIPGSIGLGIDKNAEYALKRADTLANKIIDITDVQGKYNYDYNSISGNSLHAARMANYASGMGDNVYNFNLNTKPMTPHEAMVACRGQFEMARWTA